MPRYRCNLCSKDSMLLEFVSESDKPACPNSRRERRPCGGTIGQGVILLTDVHLLAFHADGPILTPEGPRRIPCSPERAVLAIDYRFGEHFAATTEPGAVTCPACKGSDLYRDLLELYKVDAPVRAAKPRVPKGG